MLKITQTGQLFGPALYPEARNRMTAKNNEGKKKIPPVFVVAVSLIEAVPKSLLQQLNCIILYQKSDAGTFVLLCCAKYPIASFACLHNKNKRYVQNIVLDYFCSIFSMYCILSTFSVCNGLFGNILL